MNDIQNKEFQPLMVSIKCFAYNHEKFIRDTLESFVMQKTNFRFEAIVHDDASTDGTAEIIRGYAEKYPDIIKPIYETENQYSKKDGSLSRIMHEACKGKYVAICEGDDYWIDPYKLQKQVDFLESNQDYVICFHRYKQFYQNVLLFDDNIYPLNINDEGFSFNIDYYINCSWITQPLTCIYRKDIYDSIINKSFKDMGLFFFLLKEGSGYVFGDVMGVYRLNNNGVYSSLSHVNKIRADIKELISICKEDKSHLSVAYLNNYWLKCKSSIGKKFLFQNCFLLLNALILVLKYRNK